LAHRPDRSLDAAPRFQTIEKGYVDGGPEQVRVECK